MKKRVRFRFIRIFLPFLFVFYWGGITMFTHFHIVNGVIIVHSHPYAKGHEHTENEYETIFNLSSFINTPVHSVSFFKPTFWILLSIYIPFFVYTFQRSVKITTFLRAPPLSLIPNK